MARPVTYRPEPPGISLKNEDSARMASEETPMKCGKKHDHATVEEVWDCYNPGQPFPAGARQENLVPQGPAQPGPNARRNAERTATQDRNTAAARRGEAHGFTAHCSGCVADASHGQRPRHAPAAHEPSLGCCEEHFRSSGPARPTYEEPTERQLKFIGNLLRQKDLVTDTTVITALTKRTASRLIDDLLKWEPGQPLWSGIRYDKAKLSADGDPAGYGSPNPPKQAEPERKPYPNVPAGHYAVPSKTGHNDLDFYRVDRPTEGEFRGRTFVKRVIGGHPNTRVRGAEARDALERILHAGPTAAGMLYGQKIGRCCKCNRHLTDEESRARGMGPDCYAKIS